MSDGQQGRGPVSPNGPILPSREPQSGPRSQATPIRHPVGDVSPDTPLFDAVGIQSVLTRARDQSRFVPPTIEDEGGRRPVPVRALIVGFAVIALIGVLVGVGYVTFLRPDVIDPDVIAKPTATASNQVRAKTPQEIVTLYFDALSAGDIEQAMAMGPRGGNGSERLLTPAAFEATREASALNSVEILTREADATRVEVRYRLGDETFNTTIGLDRLDTGEYQLQRTTVPLQIEVPGGDDVPLLVNGVSLDQGKPYEVVPGVYELDTGLPFIAYPETSTITVFSLDDAQQATPVPQLSQAGRDAFINAATRSLDACLAAPQKEPANCPIGMPAHADVDESSIERTLTGDPWVTAQPSLTSSQLTRVEVTVTIEYNLSYTWRDGSRQSPTERRKVVTVSANMLATRADQVTVTWEE